MPTTSARCHVPVGRFADAAGQEECATCDPGSYQVERGMAVCTACERGFAQSAAEQIGCGPCSSGTFTAVQGLASCTECPVCAGTTDAKTRVQSPPYQTTHFTHRW